MSKLDKEALESLDSMRELMDNADCLISQEQVERALDRMAEEITRDLGDKLPVFYCVMNGGLITTGHLLTRLGFPLEVDYLHATRYRNELRGGELFWRVSPEIPMAGRHVVIVDDILDEGATLAAILEYCKEAKAASVTTAVLVEGGQCDYRSVGRQAARPQSRSGIKSRLLQPRSGRPLRVWFWYGLQRLLA